MYTAHHLSGVAILLCLIIFATGCQTPRYDGWPTDAPRTHDLAPADVDDVRELPALSGHDGTALTWQQIIDAADWAHVIIIGEQHDDAIGHEVQRAIVEDVFDRHPGSVLSMEMLTRDHQIFADDYVDGIIDARTLVRLAGVADWAGPDSWTEWYQPIVDAAKDRGGRIIAANAPRRYVRLARMEGYDRLRALPRERRALFDLPGDHDDSAYRERFFEVMTAMGDAHRSDDDDNDGQTNDESHDHDHHHMDHAHLAAMFRSQMLWDATMARSIINVRPRRDRKVIHLCGRFHSDFEGGTVLETRRHRPMLRVLTISMVREEAPALRGDDRGRADVVIYTGEAATEEQDDAGAEDDSDDES